MARLRHTDGLGECLLFGVERKSLRHGRTVAFDPTSDNCCSVPDHAKNGCGAPFSPFRSITEMQVRTSSSDMFRPNSPRNTEFSFVL
jgi:hypothetical protein